WGVEVGIAPEAGARDLGGEPAQEMVDVDRRVGHARDGPHPDEPVSLRHREGQQRVLLAGKTGEALRTGNVDEPAVEGVGPAVVRAAERALAASAAFEDARAAVPTDVRERMQRAPLAPEHEDRHA